LFEYLVKRDTPSSSSNLNHHQQYHQTAMMENFSSLITNNKSASVELTPSTNLMKIPTVSSTSSLFVQTPTSSPLITIGNFTAKLSKYSSNFNQQDSSLFNFLTQENTNEKKLTIVRRRRKN